MAAGGNSNADAWEGLGFVPGPVLRIFGMRRSGNHAIAAWLQRNAPAGRALFLNNCKPGSDPLKTFRSIELDGAHAPHRKAVRDLPSVAAAAGDGALLLISYEDSSPAEFADGGLMSGPFDERRITTEVAVYRSFLNWAASLLKKLQGNPGYSLSRRNAILLRAMDTYGRLLALVDQARTLGLACICYDRWAADAGYRAGLLDQLGLEQRDNSLGAVQRYGGGSSFQKDAASAGDLQTATRWQQMAADPEYQSVLHLAARDEALTARLARLFPRDAAVLARITSRAPLPQEVFA